MYVALNKLKRLKRDSECDRIIAAISKIPNAECTPLSYETRFFVEFIYLYILFKCLFVGQTTQFLSWTTYFFCSFFSLRFSIYSRKSSSLLSSYKFCGIYNCIVSIIFISFYRRTESWFFFLMLLLVWKKPHEKKLQLLR